MSDIRQERLRQLRRVIEAADPDRLHMRAWSEKAPCGTAYCAAGWAAIDPWFQANTSIGEIFVPKPSGHLGVRADDPFRPLANLFDLTPNDSTNLFGGGVYYDCDPHAVTKDEVIANIDRLLAGEHAKTYAAIDSE